MFRRRVRVWAAARQASAWGGVRARIARLICLVSALLLGAGVLSPAIVSAQRLPGPVLIGFEESYKRDGRDVVHSGVDVMMSAGSEVPCLRGGGVVFAGTVPAGPGQSTLAVTVEDDAGRRWSYMPIEELDVHEGASVAEGVSLGVLAGSGDRSSPTPHLHVGLRIDGEYSDPVTVLGVRAQQPAEPGGAVEPAEESPLAVAPTLPSAPVLDPTQPVNSMCVTEGFLADVVAAAPTPVDRTDGADVRPASAVYDACAVAVRDRQSAPVPAMPVEATAGTAAPGAGAHVTLALLGMAILGGIIVGAARSMRVFAPTEVRTDPRPTRLQPR